MNIQTGKTLELKTLVELNKYFIIEDKDAKRYDGDDGFSLYNYNFDKIFSQQNRYHTFIDINNGQNKYFIFTDSENGTDYTVINEHGKLISKFRLSSYLSFENSNIIGEDLLFVDGGFINLFGNFVIPRKTYSTRVYNIDNIYFCEGISLVANKDDKYGFIDKNHTQILPFVYKKCTPFKNGTSFCNLNDEEIIINKSGQILFNFTKNNLSCDGYGTNGKKVVVQNKTNKKYGIFDIISKQILWTEYKLNMDFSSTNHLVAENQEGDKSLLNEKGELILPFGEFRIYSSSNNVNKNSNEHGIVFSFKTERYYKLNLN